MDETSPFCTISQKNCKNTGHVKVNYGLLKTDSGSDASHDGLLRHSLPLRRRDMFPFYLLLISLAQTVEVNE